MNDEAWVQTQLAASVAPNRATWPTDYDHFLKLGAAVDFARRTVAESWSEMEAITNDRDLTPEAKTRRREQIARAAIDALESSVIMAQARESATQIIGKFESAIRGKIKAPETDTEIARHAEIRQVLRTEVPAGEKLAWLAKHGDPEVLSAALTAPQSLTGLTDAEIAAAKGLVEKNADPETVSARNAVKKALNEVERGFLAAKERVASKA